MWVFSMAQQHKVLLLWTGRLSKHASITRVDSYHVSAFLLRAEVSGIDPVVKRRRRALDTSGVQHKPVASAGWQKYERSDQSKAWKREIPELHRPNQGREGDSRMSSELSKLSLDDFPAQRERMMGAQRERMKGGQKERIMGGQKDRMHPREEQYEVVFGVAPCLLALTQGRRKARKLFVKDGEASRRDSVITVCAEAHRRGVQVQRVSKKDLDKMSSGPVHQGVCLQASPLSYLAEDGDSAAPSWRDPPLWLVLERVVDPMNLGAILRSAYFLGVDRVISSIRHSCPLSPVVSKASSGVMEVTGVYGYDNLEDMLKLKVTQGWQVIGTVGAKTDESPVPVTRCSDFQMTKPTMLLMGGEGEGLSQQLLALCQTLLTIPAGRELFPGVESLNVSVASGILLHSLLSRRSTGRRTDTSTTLLETQDVLLDPLEVKGVKGRPNTRTKRDRLSDSAAVKREVF
ncbi:rRNA methyltransferase 1, mitochondrial [Pseudoliparis swirei]|uniref:rRNA methyltransferase 1, mitochondrial n=1 Tax=Pseudoliparis swirei TaxID=2059687 RepID=UPI0024BEEC78|nr:rRNA methyltransferase 1, mitochondrial [Pseudoliparis swirei]